MGDSLWRLHHFGRRELVLVGYVSGQSRSERLSNLDVVTMVVLALVMSGAVGATLIRQSSIDSTASARLVITDPVDGWLDGPGGLEADLELAAAAVPEAVVVRIGRDGRSLEFKASGGSSATNQTLLAQSLAAYEVKRSNLRAELERRLEFLPALVEVAAVRSDQGTETAQWMVRLAGSWNTSPVESRLESIDRVLSEAFWQVAAPETALAATDKN